MCWASRANIVEPQIADHNIPIFKILTPTLSSYFYSFRYTLNKKYETHLDALYFDGTYYTIHQGFHTYLDEITEVIYNVLTTEVFHKNCSVAIEMYINPAVKVQGYIPKGAIYFINDLGECVSDKIVLTKICD